MKRLSFVVVLVAVLALSGVTACGGGKKKIKAYTSQVETTFRNETSQPAHGLHVVFTAETRLMRRESHAERFQQIKGDGTKTIRLLEASDPVEAAESLPIVFGTRNSKVRLKAWWWTDAQGHRIGPKDQEPNARKEQKKLEQEQERQARVQKKEQERLEKEQRKEAKRAQKQDQG